MTSTVKTAITLTTSAISDGATIDAADVLTPFADALTHLKSGRLSVSANDLYAKHLNDALLVTSPLVKAIGSAAADESLGVTFDYTNNCIDMTGTAGETLTARDAVYIDIGSGLTTVKKIDADTAAVRMGILRGFVVADAASSAPVTVRIMGPMTGFSALSAFDDVWASGTQGVIVGIMPTLSAGGAQTAYSHMGWSLSTTSIFILPSRRVRYMKRASTANNGTFTIIHHYDEEPFMRQISAWILDATPYYEPAVVGRWAAGTRDVAVRYDDGAGSNVATKTTFKNVTGGTVDMTGIVDLL